MGIDVKEIQGFTWKIVIFSMKTCCRCVQKYPVASGILLFSFALYIFLPPAFYFLLYSSPFLACTAAFLHFYPKFRHSRVENVARKDREALAKSRRTLKSRIERERGEQEVKIVKEKEMEMVSPIAGLVTSLHDGGSCSRDVSIGSKSDIASRPPKKRAPNLSVGSEAELDHESSEDEEEVTSAGGSQENLHKAVEWNEDDQKNLMDLGISEIERNRRLESLIARRRARKMYKLQVGKNLIDMDSAPLGPGGLIAPLMVSRNNPFTDPQDEHIPGSAPSILLPGRNPFDIPYDPSEEKPDLTADSFQQEFMPPIQRDMIFTRHESFFLGPSYPIESFIDQPDGNLYSRIRTPFDKREDVNSSPLSFPYLTIQKGESSTETRNSMVQEKGEMANAPPEDKEQTTSNSSGNSQPAAGFKFPPMSQPSPNSLPCPIPKFRPINVKEDSYESIPSVNDNLKLEDRLYYQHQVSFGPMHTPAHSIASDMQVEVSDVGSPPLTVDGSHSYSDDESLTYDGDIDRDAVSSGGEELWGASPHCPRVDDQESRWTPEVNQIEEEVMIGVSPFGKETDDLQNSSAPSLRADSAQEEDQVSSDVKPATDGAAKSVTVMQEISEDVSEKNEAGSSSYPEGEVGVWDDPGTSSARQPLVSQASIPTPDVSPKSVLPADDDPAVTFSPELSQQILAHVSESEMRENIARDALLDEQYSQPCDPDTPQNAQLVVDQATEMDAPLLSIDSSPEKSEEQSSKSNEIMNDKQGATLGDVEDLKSTQEFPGELGSLTINQAVPASAAAELSKPQEEINNQPTMHEDSTNTNFARESAEEAYLISHVGSPSMNEMGNEDDRQLNPDSKTSLNNVARQINEKEAIGVSPSTISTEGNDNDVARQINEKEAIGVSPSTICTEGNDNNATSNEDRVELGNLSQQSEIVDLINPEDDDNNSDNPVKPDTDEKDPHKHLQENSIAS